ncbi:MAG: AmmeMemoRadiSam system protein A [Acidimicrobiia bacterium]
MSELTASQLETLAAVAAEAVRAATTADRCWVPDPCAYEPSLRGPAAVFVTLRHLGRLARRGQLRGCVGTLTPEAPLVVAIADRARAAAFDDPRFDAIQPDELDDLAISVSVLSPLEPLAVDSYDELLRALRPGIDGIVIDAGRHRATFLPSVWEEIPTPERFLDALWRKASLPARAWPPETRVSRYTASHSREVPVLN